MIILIDLVVIGIIILSTYLGYKKGLIGVAFKILSFIIAIIITLILYKPVTNIIIQNTTWDEKIEQTIKNIKQISIYIYNIKNFKENFLIINIQLIK